MELVLSVNQCPFPKQWVQWVGCFCWLAFNAYSQSLPLAWGHNSAGTLGNASFQTFAAPMPVVTNGYLAGHRVVALAGGWAHSAAVTDDGRAFFWGQSIVGTTSDGTFLDYLSPTPVEDSGILTNRALVALSAGIDFTMALDSTGHVFGWGVNASGQLGSGNQNPARDPIAVDVSGVLAGKSVMALASGAYHSLAITSDGLLVGWGEDSISQIGDGGQFVQRVSPVAVSTNSAIAGLRFRSVAAGEYHSLALSTSGRVYSWGLNLHGQLGTGDVLDQKLPVSVSTSGVLSNKTVVAIAAGLSFSLALADTGELFAWGDNEYGQLGDGTTSERHSPVLVGQTGALAGKRVAAMTTGAAHALAVTSDGILVAWGLNEAGRLGDGTGQSRSAPVPVYTNGWLGGRFPLVLASGSTANHSMILAISGPPQLSVALAGQLPTLSLRGLSNTLYRIDGSSTVGTHASWSGITNALTDTHGAFALSNPASPARLFWRASALP